MAGWRCDGTAAVGELDSVPELEPAHRMWVSIIRSDVEELSRFVALTGIAPDEFRALAGTPDFMAAVLDFFLGNEATLLAFSAQADIAPQAIKSARYALSPPSNEERF